jgi:hypothetical protein
MQVNWSGPTLSILAVFIAGATAEIFLRQFSLQEIGPIQFHFDPELGAITTPDQHGQRTVPGQYSYRYRNDRSGLRVTPPGSSSHQALVFLGDSFTYGVGVNDD